MNRLKARSWDYSKFKMEYPTVYEDPANPGTYLPGEWIANELLNAEKFDFRDHKKVKAFNKKRRGWVDSSDCYRVDKQENGAVKHEMDGETDDEEVVVDLDRYCADPVTIKKWGPRGIFQGKRNIIRWTPEKEAEEKALKKGKKRKAVDDEATGTKIIKKARASPQDSHDGAEADHNEEVERQEEEEDSLFVPEGSVDRRRATTTSM